MELIEKYDLDGVRLHSRWKPVKDGWMLFFFLPEGGRGWRKNPVADVENAIIFFVEMKKGRFE